MNILDDFNREALWIEIDTSLPAERVFRVLEMLIDWRGRTEQICMDNGPEQISHRLQNWAREHQILLAHIQPGKPSQNAYVERFKRAKTLLRRRRRDACGQAGKSVAVPTFPKAYIF